MRILVTSDNHVGYNETDPLRGSDSAITFDEVMKIAQESEVDFVLQGGDLFHINKPSKRSLYDVVKTLRSRCLGDKPIEFEMLHHGQLSLDQEFDHANFEDPNINIAIPVFAISGNHDDRGGTVLLSPLDMLACTGLINYFGRVLDNDSIEVTPLLFQKGGVKVALYGLSNVRDERLHRAFRNGNVKFLTTADQDTYFNILVVHQNRSAHTETNYLPETFLPTFFNLVIWGHEHECRIDPEISPNTGFEVLQPGSSVATSLCEGEAVKKGIGILDIKGEKTYSVEKVPLRTIRPFKMKTVSVKQDSGIKHSKDAEKQISSWMRSEVEQLIEEANDEWRSLNPDGQEPPLPLIRLRVDYSGGYDVENPTRFSNKFGGRVANPNDVVQYTKRRESSSAKSKSNHDIEYEAPSTNNKVQLSELVHQFLGKQSLQVIPEKGMNAAIAQFVDQDDKSALKDFVDLTLRTNVETITSENVAANSGLKSAPVVSLSDDEDYQGSVNITSRDPETMDTDGEEFTVYIEAAKSKVRSRRTQPSTANIEMIEIDSDSPVEDEEEKEEIKPKPKPKPRGHPKKTAEPGSKKAPANRPPRKPAAPKPATKPKPAPYYPPLEDNSDSDDGFD